MGANLKLAVSVVCLALMLGALVALHFRTITDSNS